MTQLWQLPRSGTIGGKVYPIHADFRDILEIFSYLQDPDLPEFLRWSIALGLFYDGIIPEADFQEAADFFCRFVSGWQQTPGNPGPVLIDWQQDAADIISDVNRVAGQEIRSLPFLHWWTFLSWFHGIGEGQLSALVCVREKLSRGKKLEGWEKEFYSRNRERVNLRKKYSASELAEQERLQKLLG